VGGCYHDRYKTMGFITKKIFPVFRIYIENKESPYHGTRMVL